MQRRTVSRSLNTSDDKYIRLAPRLEKASFVWWAPKLSLTCRNLSCSRMTTVIEWSEPGSLSKSGDDICSMQSVNCRWRPVPPITLRFWDGSKLGNNRQQAKASALTNLPAEFSIQDLQAGGVLLQLGLRSMERGCYGAENRVSC